MEVGLSPDQIVLDGNPAPLPNFWPTAVVAKRLDGLRCPLVSLYAVGPLSVCPVCNIGVLWRNGWTDRNETWHRGGLGPGHIVLDRL